MSFFGEIRARGGSNDAFSISGLAPARQPRRRGLERLAGGPKRLRDMERTTGSLFDEEEKEDLRRDLDDAPERAVSALRRLDARYKSALGPAALTPEEDDDPDRPFRDQDEALKAIKSPAYKKSEVKRAEVERRLTLAPVIQTNLSAPSGLLGDDLRAKDAPPIELVRVPPAPPPVVRSIPPAPPRGGHAPTQRNKVFEKSPDGLTPAQRGARRFRDWLGDMLWGDEPAAPVREAAPAPKAPAPPPLKDLSPLEAPAPATAPEIPHVGPTQDRMDPRIKPERDYYSAHPSHTEAWQIVPPDDMTPEQLRDFEGSFDGKSVEGVFIDPDGVRRRHRVPVFTMDPARWPDQHHQELAAPHVDEGDFDPLHRKLRSASETAKLRRENRKKVPKREGYEINEYPPLSTMERDQIDDSYGTLGHSPRNQNSSNGAFLRWFYSRNGLVRGGLPYYYWFRPRDEEKRDGGGV